MTNSDVIDYLNYCETDLKVTKQALQSLKGEAAYLRELLSAAAGYTRRPDYDWDIEFIRAVDEAIK